MRARQRATDISVVAWALAGAGVVCFATTAGALGHGVRAAALAVVAGAVLVTLMRHVDPAWLMSGGIVLTMFSGHWPLVGISSNVGPERIVLAAAMVALLLRFRPARGRPPLRLTRVHFVLAAALAYAVVSAIVAGSLSAPGARFQLLDEYGVFPYLLFTFAPLAFATERQREILLGTVVGVGVYLSLTALFEKLHLNALVVPSYITDPTVGIHWGRARGPFVDASADGLALFACAVAAAIALTRWRGRWQRAVAGAVLVLAPIGILLTETRGDWIAAIGGGLVILGTTPGLRRYLVPVALITTVAIAVSFAVVPGLAAQVQQRASDQSSVYERDNTNAAGLRMVAARPFMGFGWGQSDANILPYFRLDPTRPLTGRAAGFHDIYLQYAVELGLVGLALWVVAGAVAFGSALVKRAPPEIRPWQVGLKGLIVAWMIIALTSPAAFIFSTILLWTWAGIVAGPSAEDEAARLVRSVTGVAPPRPPATIGPAR